MAKYIMLLACFMATQVTAANWRPSERLLHAVRSVESADGLLTWGDNGRSLGDYQLSEAAWIDVNAGERRGDFRRFNTKPMCGTGSEPHVCRGLSHHLSTSNSRSASAVFRPRPKFTPHTIMGHASFAQCQYQFGQVNPTTARKCQLIEAIMEAR